MPDGYRRYHESEVRFTWNLTLTEMEQLATLLDYYIVRREVPFKYQIDRVLANQFVVHLEECQEACRGTYRPYRP